MKTQKLTNLQTKQIIAKVRTVDNQHLLLDLLKPRAGICYWWFARSFIHPDDWEFKEVKDGWLAFLNIKHIPTETVMVFGVNPDYRLTQLYPDTETPTAPKLNYRRPSLNEVREINELWIADYESGVVGENRKKCFKIISVAKLLGQLQSYVMEAGLGSWGSIKQRLLGVSWVLLVSHDFSMAGEAEYLGTHMAFALDHNYKVMHQILKSI